MKPFLLALFIVAFAGGCSTNRTVVAFSPTDTFHPQTGAELLAELNSQLPFQVGPRQFLCKAKGDHLVGWAVVDTVKQTDIVKTNLKASKTLHVMQVEELSPEFEMVLKQNWRKSQIEAVSTNR